ncbi:nucleoside triphosphate pyrophosphohydrolase family protein [Flavobacterium psychrophilum]|uniref:Nucleoside triphosphate pyrophosphohydrolase family protein n=1 Tax=Flavobacterium psychrophilum TaxID=96345 RepID=A0A7U2NE69_FLAPS|nr:nucleoside triphosphate pyrophosphohydrolase family protein [Flavobacterium psychrophilum]QRE03541.1 nucleoside triphosphate pyrophosphohydrolase family protein [Flavobacterium psychrophilum]
MKFKEILNKVASFQLASSQEVNTSPTLGDLKESVLRFELMEEENYEYLTANQDEDLTEALDACVDMLYVLAGTINKHGFQDIIAEAFNLVHENNMTKVVDRKVIRNADGKIMKPEDFQPVNLTNLLKKN